MNHFTNDFVSYGEKTYLKAQEISERILLAIYGLGTNVGLKHMCSGNPHISYHQLKHIKDYFISSDNLKHALTKVANALFEIRLKDIWGEIPIAVGSDSTQFSAYFQNLISDYHNRYGGRGVMIYWHVEKNACCIHSQLKSVSSSEVAAMIEGVLRHCTEMSVQKNYVDTHGQSEIGFAFSYLLGFSLMPRLANLNKQKLAQCEIGDYHRYKNLQPILGDSINWQLIKEQYSQIVKYTAAMKAGHADPESILRRFNQNNLKHPTYMALSQIIKVLLYTGVRVSELVNIQLCDIDLTNCRIKINQGKGKKDRVVPFSPVFKETLAIRIKHYKNENRLYLFESGFRRNYTDRGVRKILMRHTKHAGIERSISPHKLRHFLFTWLKTKNIDDDFIQPYSGHVKRDSLEIYSKLSLANAQDKYNDVIGDFPV